MTPGAEISGTVNASAGSGRPWEYDPKRLQKVAPPIFSASVSCIEAWRDGPGVFENKGRRRMTTLQQSILLTAMLLLAVQAWGGDKVDAALGGAIGGGAGAAIGEELGGRDGAIVGGAIGGAVGAAIATDEDRADRSRPTTVVRPVLVPGSQHPAGRHCPPGQAKKGRC